MLERKLKSSVSPIVVSAFLVLLAGCPDSGDDDATSQATNSPEPTETYQPTEPTPTAIPVITATPTEASTPVPTTPTPVPTTPTPPTDVDGDGYVAALDCDDTNPDIHPGADEVCNDIDDDCNGAIDDGLGFVDYFLDQDADGFGAGDPYSSCNPLDGYSESGDDCDDTNPDIHPGADEVCNDIDDDCNGAVDDDPVDGTTWHEDADQDGFGAGSGEVFCEAPSPFHVEDGSDCDDADPRTFPGAQEICDGVDNDCDGEVDDACPSAILLPPPDFAYVPAPPEEGACGLFGEMSGGPDPHNVNNLDTYMAMLEGTAGGLVSSTAIPAPVLDWSMRYAGDPLANPGNYTDTTQPWPDLSPTGTCGASRFRGYLNIRPQDPLNVTIGLIGNDALRLFIQGQEIVWVNWADGRWKKFRYVSFPAPGLYTFEVQWSTNFCCYIDPLEVVWAEGFVPGYEDYDTMCSYDTCEYGTGHPIPGFFIIGAPNLVPSTSGAVHDCVQCDATEDCPSGQVCNTAGLCE